MHNIFNDLANLGFTDTPAFDTLFQKKGAKANGKGSDSDVDQDPDISDYIFLKEHECPVCGSKFDTVTFRARKTRYLRSDTDLRPYYSPFDPLYYGIVMCYYCGYAAMTAHFNELTEKQSERISEAIKPQYRYKEYPLPLSVSDAAEQYQLALLCATLKHVLASEKAMLCLRLSWLSRDRGDVEREREYQLHAIEGFEIAYEEEKLPVYGLDSMSICYLLGELCRRVGRNDDAMRHLSRVISSRTANKRIKERVREIRDLIKEES